MSAVLDAAMGYAAAGWPTLPLKPKDKAPATRHGFKDASLDPNQLDSWFGGTNDPNIGVVTGSASGILVVDFDPRNGGEDGLAKFEQRYGQLPPTRRANTGGGGFHLLFKLPPGARVRGRSNIDKLGIDLKADGGYIVAPPSIHPSGRPYQWANDNDVAARLIGCSTSREGSTTRLRVKQHLPRAWRRQGPLRSRRAIATTICFALRFACTGRDSRQRRSRLQCTRKMPLSVCRRSMRTR